jgi:hypothetical protein
MGKEEIMVGRIEEVMKETEEQRIKEGSSE